MSGNNVVYSRAGIHISSAGSMTCSNPEHETPDDPWNSTRWCEHIESLIVNHADSDFITFPDREQVEKYLEVPMFPTKNLWTRVRMVPSPDQKLWGVWWEECPTSGDIIFLTSLNSFEGRQVIRMTLLNYMYGDMKRIEECQDSIHAYAAQMEWTASKALAGDHTAQVWSVYFYGKCLHCLRNSDISDLVPEKEGSPWS